jgi:hypothetical protein
MRAQLARWSKFCFIVKRQFVLCSVQRWRCIVHPSLVLVDLDDVHIEFDDPLR